MKFSALAAIALCLALAGVALADKVPVYVSNHTYTTQKPLAECTSTQAMNYTDGGFVCTNMSGGNASFTFGGYVPAAYSAGVDFSQFRAPDGSTGVSLLFTSTQAGTGDQGQLSLFEVGGTAVCTMSVACASSAGTATASTCTATLKAGTRYSLRWNSASSCTSHPAGNAVLAARVN